jgi:hypothetical protein
MQNQIIIFLNSIYLTACYKQLDFTNSDIFQVDFVLEEISHLQAEGPSEEDVSTILEIEQRAHENGLQVYFSL